MTSLPDGDLYALYDVDIERVCVVVGVNRDTFELKNIVSIFRRQNIEYTLKLNIKNEKLFWI